MINERNVRIMARMKPEKSTVHYRGRVVTVSADEVVLPNGHRATLDVVHHPGGAAVVALDSGQRVCLLRQYRYVADGWLWELPAGKLEPNEPPLETAKRELIEEAGVSARVWESLGSVFSSPGVFAEVLHLFYAAELEPSVVAHESSEIIEIHWVPFSEAYLWAMNGQIRDAKTIIALARAFSVAAVRKGPAANNP